MKKQIIRNILKVFAVGGTALMLGAGVSCLFYVAGWLLFLIPNQTGWLAVGAFVGAIIDMGIALSTMYMTGCWIVRKGKFAR